MLSLPYIALSFAQSVPLSIVIQMEYVIVINNKELEDREGVAAIEQKLCMDIGQ